MSVDVGSFLAQRALAQGLGYPVRVVGANPAAGAEVSMAIPGSQYLLLVGFQVTLVTSATVASRVPSLRLTDGSNELFRVPQNAGESASLTWVNQWLGLWGSVTTSTSGNIAAQGWPSIPLRPGWVLSTVTTALQVGDDYEAPILFALAMDWGRMSGPDFDVADLVLNDLGG